MKKILFLFLILLMIVVMAACSSGTSGSGSEGVKTIKIAHGSNESYHMHKAWLEFEKDLEANGNFEVEIYPSSQFGNDDEMVESAKLGDITIATPPSSFLTDEAKNMALIELPYVFPDRETAINTLGGEWGQAQLKDLEDDGLIGMGYLENGVRHLTNNTKPVVTPQDLQGLKLRTMQVPAHVYLWNDLDAIAEGAPFAELYNNLSSGRFDGQENPISQIYAQKYYEVQKYLTLTGHVYTSYVPVMNQDFWNELTDEEKDEITTAFADARDFQLGLIAEEESGQLEEIKNNKDYPTEVTELTEEQKQLWIDAAQPTLEKYRTELGAEVFDEFNAAISEARK
ncbi:TRAP transporter substrate-binding protein [Planomicrobium sp. CPCC 101079]|uniref:TRAP transporter substrate-binding protein n=1 Tax=Planomicrobium sp. CPCC 101079 TaxID=2599618 RepID=UPI0011B76D59|nr:TRAP transporter substrate-binding protein [Planomicrobium sp. CPCC 101079]TWT01764.1 TRAP transporter substrate-binding protein [Planomicrobium sp. CPCC 101079]